MPCCIFAIRAALVAEWETRICKGSCKRNCPPFSRSETEAVASNCFREADAPGFEQQGAGSQKESPWAHAVQVGDFLRGGSVEVAWRARDLVAPEGISLLASPRGLGKTQVAIKPAIELAVGGTFRGEFLGRCRVLYLDRENSKTMLRRRFSKWGAPDETPGLNLLPATTARL